MQGKEINTYSVEFAADSEYSKSAVDGGVEDSELDGVETVAGEELIRAASSSSSGPQ